MRKQLRVLLFLLLGLFYFFESQYLYGQCDADPGNAEISGFSELINGQNIQSGETVKVTVPGTYTFYLNGGTLIVSGEGEYQFTSGCTYNGGSSIKINSGSRVIINGLQASLSLINRGELTFNPIGEQIVNLNGNALVINAGTMTVNGGFRIDSRFSNRGTVNVTGDLWLNSNDRMCLANNSIIHVGGSSNVNSAIYGDGGCLHSEGLVSRETNYVNNSGNKITPEGYLIYICGESGFADIFGFDETTNSGNSGGAVLQSNCTGCGVAVSDTVLSIESSATTICKGDSIVLNAIPSGWIPDEYLWSDLNFTTSSVVVSPLSSSVYTVNAYSSTGKQLSASVFITVIDTSIVVEKQGSSVLLTAVGGYSYRWNTGAISQSIQVSESGTYNVTLTKNGYSCENTKVIQIDTTSQEEPFSPSENSKCAIDPGDVNCNLQGPFLVDGMSISAGEIVYLFEAGTYHVNLNWGTIVICGEGPFIFTGNSTFNAGGNIIINSQAEVTMPFVRYKLDIVNRGKLIFLAGGLNSSGQITIDAGSRILNVGEIEFNDDLRLDDAIYNLGKINVDGNLYINGTYPTLCLGKGSIMHIDSITQMDTPINGDGGCLHVRNVVGNTNMNWPNNNKSEGYYKLAEEDQLIYVCTDKTFAAGYQIVDGVGRAGGAILEEQCAGKCNNTGGKITIKRVDSIGVGGKDLSGSEITVCPGEFLKLKAEFVGEEEYSYIWNNGTVGDLLQIRPKISFVYTVTAKNKAEEIVGEASITVRVLPVSIKKVEENESFATLVASGGENYVWSNGENTDSITVNQSGEYGVDIEIDSFICHLSQKVDLEHIESCIIDSGDIDCRKDCEIVATDSLVINNGEIVCVSSPGIYSSIRLEKGTLVVCSEGSFVFENCEFNPEGQLYINSPAMVTINNSSVDSLNLFNRGKTVINLLNGQDSLTESSSVVNTGVVEINGDLSVNGEFLNKGTALLYGSLLIEEKAKMCLDFNSEMKVDSIIDIKTDINGFNGCLHILTTITTTTYYKITQEFSSSGKIVVSTKKTFAEEYNIVDDFSKSGSAYLYSNTDNCVVPPLRVLSVKITGKNLICNGDTVSLQAVVEEPDFDPADYIYQWEGFIETSNELKTTQSEPKVIYAVKVINKKDGRIGYSTFEVVQMTVSAIKTTPDYTELIAVGGSSFEWCNGAKGERTVIPNTQGVCSVKSLDTQCIYVVEPGIEPDPFPIITLTGRSVCKREADTLSVEVLLGSGDYSYKWNVPGETASSIIVNPTVSTNYIVTVRDNKLGFDTTLNYWVYVPAVEFEKTSTGVAIKTMEHIYSYQWSTGESTPSIDLSDSEIEKLTLFVVDSFANQCEIEITFDPEIILELIVTGSEQRVCKGSEVLFSVTSVTGGSGEYLYEWNGVSSNESSVSIYPEKSGKYAVTVYDKNDMNLNTTAEFNVEVISAEVKRLKEEESQAGIYFVASGGTSYRWYDMDNPETVVSTDSKVKIPSEEQFFTYIAEITDGAVLCRDTVIYPEPTSINFEVGGDRSICIGDSVRFDIQIKNVNPEDCEIYVNEVLSPISFTLSPSKSTEYKIVLLHKPTGKSNTKVVSLSISDCPPKIENCGQKDLAEEYYAASGEVSDYTITGSTWISEGNYRIQNPTSLSGIGSLAKVYLESNSRCELQIGNIEGTLVFLGTGPYILKGGGLNLSGTAIISKGATVIVEGDLQFNTHSASLYNRGVFTSNNIFMNNHSIIVNSGKMVLTNNFTNNYHGNDSIKLTNYGTIDVGGNFISYANNVGLSLEYGSVANFNNISIPTNTVLCNGCIHYTGTVSGNYIANSGLEICSAPGSGALNNETVLSECNYCSLSGKGDTLIVKESTFDKTLASVTLGAVALGGSGGPYSYEWLSGDCIGITGVLPFGGLKNKITCDIGIEAQFPLTEDYEKKMLIKITDQNTGVEVETTVLFRIIKESQEDTLSVNLYGGGFVCNGETSLMIAEITGFTSGDYEFRWGVRTYGSTEEFTLLDCRSDKLTYLGLLQEGQSESLYEYRVSLTGENENTVASAVKIIRVLSSEKCHTSSCCRNKFLIDILEYPTCIDNGRVRLIVNDLNCLLSDSTTSGSDIDSIFVRWSNDQGVGLSTSKELTNLPSGTYYVEAVDKECSFFTSFELTNKEDTLNSVNKGWIVGYYEKGEDNSGGQSGSGSGTSTEDPFIDYGCVYSSANKISTTYVSTLEEGLSAATEETGAVRFTAYFTPVCTGTYTFTRKITEGRFFINTTSIFSDTAVSATVQLDSGRSYAIIYELSNIPESEIKLKWQSDECRISEEDLPSCLISPQNISLLPFYITTPEIDSIIIIKNDTVGSEVVSYTTTTSEGCDPIPPCSLSVSDLQNPVELCFDGAVAELDAFVDGATYLWWDGTTESRKTVSKAGTYKVTITAWCGTRIDYEFSVQTMEDAGVGVIATSVTSCAGDSIILEAQGGISYLWKPESEFKDNTQSKVKVCPASTRTYSVSITTRGGCTVSDYVNVNIKEPFSLEIDSTISACLDSVVTLSVEGADEYIWYPADGLSCKKCATPEYRIAGDSTEFYVTGKKNDCTKTAKVKIKSIYPSLIAIESESSGSANCTLEFVASSQEFDTYTWIFEDGTEQTLSGNTSLTHQFPSKGIYRVKLIAEITTGLCSGQKVEVVKIIEITEEECSCNGCE